MDDEIDRNPESPAEAERRGDRQREMVEAYENSDGEWGVEDVDQLMREVAEGGADSARIRYGVADYPDDAHRMVALPKKKSERLQQSEPDDATDMVNLLYTNAPMTRETAESIAEDYICLTSGPWRTRPIYLFKRTSRSVPFDSQVGQNHPIPLRRYM